MLEFRNRNIIFMYMYVLLSIITKRSSCVERAEEAVQNLDYLFQALVQYAHVWFSPDLRYK